MPAPRQRGRTPPDGGYGIRENPRQDVWGTGEPVVHEDEWTVGQAAQAPQERNRVESKESFDVAPRMYKWCPLFGWPVVRA